MTEFVIRKTASGRYMAFAPSGKHVSGNAYRTKDEANAEITGWVAGWNATFDHQPIRGWSWKTENAETEEAA